MWRSTSLEVLCKLTFTFMGDIDGLTCMPTIQSPGKMHLVHFKSRDLDRLHRQGQFWHIFFTNGSCIISQDEVDTWTVHLALPLDVETSQLDPKEVIFRVLGGTSGPFEIEVDEVLLHNTWRPSLAVADSYRTSKGRVFLAGDSGKVILAHFIDEYFNLFNKN